MKAKRFDRKFDSGADITRDLHVEHAARRGLTQRRINIDFPAWMIDRLNREARRLGVARQS